MAVRGCLRLLLGLLLGGLLAAGRTLGIRSRLTRLLLSFLFAGHICGDLLSGGVLGDRLAAGALIGRPVLTGLALLLLLFLVRNLTGNRNALADQLFDILEVRTLGAVAEGNRGALLTGYMPEAGFPLEDMFRFYDKKGKEIPRWYDSYSGTRDGSSIAVAQGSIYKAE